MVRSLVWLVAGAGSLAAGEPSDLPRHAIVFAQHADDARRDYDLWRMCPDGTQIASLVVEPGHQYGVTVSPDGTEIVYSSPQDDQQDLWRRSFTGGDAVNLTNHPGKDVQPAWSPDGTSIAFFSDRDAEKLELYLLHLDDARVERLTENPFYDSGASWSPDGSTIVFTRFYPDESGEKRSGDGEVIALEVASGEERQLTELGGYNGGLSFSPDGRTIAFHRAHEGEVELWLVDADGSNARALTDTFVDEYSPAWSPDGGWLVFTAGTEHDGRGTFDLWLMRPDGSDRRLLNAAPNTQMSPKWRPGKHHCR